MGMITKKAFTTFPRKLSSYSMGIGTFRKTKMRSEAIHSNMEEQTKGYKVVNGKLIKVK